MKVRYCSDLHLEFNDLPKCLTPNPNEILLVAGDTVPCDFLRPERTDAKGRSLKKAMHAFLELTAGYAKVVFVGGNHEAYNGDINTWKHILENFIAMEGYSVGGIAPFGGVQRDMAKFHVLENESIWLTNKVLLFGCTLWTDMFKGNPVVQQAVSGYMNDFKGAIRIDEENRFFDTTDAILRHQQSLDWLKTRYQLCDGQKPKDFFWDVDIWVMTHHAPTGQSIEAGRGSATDYGYFSELSEFILDRPRIKHWFHGHTHYNVEYQVGECSVHANCRGYNMPPRLVDSSFRDFNLDKFVEAEGDFNGLPMGSSGP